MECINCKNENKPNAQFCSECGTPLFNNLDPKAVSSSNAISAIKRANRSVSIQHSVVIGSENSMDLEDMDDMEEARQGIDLLRQLKRVKRDDVAGYQEIENRKNMLDAELDINKIKAKQGGSKRKGELVGLDIARTLNELRKMCADDEDVYSINMKLDILRKMVKDDQSIKLIEVMSKRINTIYDDFSKPKDEDKKRIMNLCKYIEDAYCTDLIHGEGKDDNGYGDDLKD